MFHMKQTEVSAETHPPICDYEGSPYQTAFWGDSLRDYEDRAERIALQALVPPSGRRIIEIGAGFGRLADLYQGYQQIILLDYAKSTLQEAQARLGREPHYTYVVGNLYDLPIASHAIQTLVMVRVMHHLHEVPLALRELTRIAAPQGNLILEYASKRHLKAMIRYLLRRQRWSPFALEPYEFVPLNFNFHPAWMSVRLQEVGLSVEAERAVSWFRLPLLKRLLGSRPLAALDGLLQPLGTWLKITPSVFLRATAPDQTALSTTSLFRCPICRDESFQPQAEALLCSSCHARWPIDDGIYDFKTPLADQD